MGKSVLHVRLLLAVFICEDSIQLQPVTNRGGSPLFVNDAESSRYCHATCKTHRRLVRNSADTRLADQEHMQSVPPYDCDWMQAGAMHW